MHQPLAHRCFPDAVLKFREFLRARTQPPAVGSAERSELPQLPDGIAIVRDAEGAKAIPFARKVHMLQEQVELDTIQKLAGDPSSGYYHVDSPKTLRDKLARPGTELFVLEINGEVVGYELYWKTRGRELERLKKASPLAGKFRELLEEAFDGDDNPWADMRFGIDCEAVILPQVRNMTELEASHASHARRALYAMLHKHVVADMVREGMHFGVATCRLHPCPNPALTAHGVCDWQVLNPEQVLVRENGEVPGVIPRESHLAQDRLESAVLWLDVEEKRAAQR